MLCTQSGQDGNQNHTKLEATANLSLSPFEFLVSRFNLSLMEWDISGQILKILDIIGTLDENRDCPAEIGTSSAWSRTTRTHIVSCANTLSSSWSIVINTCYTISSWLYVSLAFIYNTTNHSNIISLPVTPSRPVPPTNKLITLIIPALLLRPLIYKYWLLFQVLSRPKLNNYDMYRTSGHEAGNIWSTRKYRWKLHWYR